MIPKPLRNGVIVKQDTAEEKTKGGIIIPDTVKNKPLTGIVVAIGPGKGIVVKDDPEKGILMVEQEMTVAVGDRVLFGYSAGGPIMIEEVEHLLMREDDILCIL